MEVHFYQLQKKSPFIFRLEAYERNKNFGNTDVLEPDFYIKVPEASCYKDVNSDTKFCSLSMETITTYLEQFDKELECDLIKNFYNENFCATSV